MSLAWSAYRVAATGVGMIAPAARFFASPRERSMWDERLGRVSWEGGCHAWIHSASLGEALGVGPLLGELGALQPGARFWLTASTPAGRGRLQSLGPPMSLAPLDAPQIVRRFVHGIQPARLLLVETELWPHWLLRARSEGIPVAVVSARMSPRSVRRYRRLGSDFRSLLGDLQGVLCQTHEDAERWIRAGAPPERTAVSGNLKSDALPSAAPDRGAARLDLGLERDRPLLVLGSIRPGEARVLARACAALPEAVRQRWQVVAVPRHPRATHELMREAAEAGVPSSRTRAAADAWRWEDRLGVLPRYYSVSDAAFVGGSLLPYGGHNPLEPAACGAAVVMGSHYATQRAGVTTLMEREAIRIVGGESELRATLADLLADEAGCRARGEAARAAVAPLRGAAHRAAGMLAAWRLWPAA